VAVADAIAVPRRETLVEAVSQALIRYIAAQGLRGGDRLPSERELVQMTGASRLPLREALSVLKGLGVIEARHGKGIFVKELDMAALFGMLSPLLKTHAKIDVHQLFEVRLHLEASVAELAAANRRPENLDALEASLAAMHATVRTRRAYSQHDMDFHQELARATGNPIFHVFMSSITDLLGELQYRYLDSVEFRQSAIVEHEEILAAVRNGDAAAARENMRRHIYGAMQRI
jgi:GntR family transcriptional repressor for pyruvate dehydrogenase complex